MTSNKPKERRIVTWTQQEDDILREQISIHGTENWTIIASKFQDKTTRQCRRRWYTYLNSDFKRGGWSPEEDILLCEAQKIFGNRWTEIAKVVSGRTDNAVKNRFTTLCKKRAKREAMVNETRNTFINANSKRILMGNVFDAQGMVDISSPLKKLRREHISNAKNSLVSLNKASLINGNKKTEGTFIRKDDPKVAALMQQAELLSSLAVKVNSESTDQSFESAWKVLHNFINKSKDGKEVEYSVEDVDLHFGDLKDLMEELRNSNDEIEPTLRQNNGYQSPSSSDYSTGSTILSSTASEYGEQSQSEICTMHEDILPCTTIDQEFNSPIQVTPIFRSLASTIPSPQFSESERHFLLRTLGIESPTPNSISNNLQPPPCRKSLLQGL